MNSASSTHRTETTSCCFWIKHSDTCADIKHGIVITVAALAAIAAATCVLLILANQGYQVGALNSLTQFVGEQWLYLAAGLATLVLTIDAIIIALMIRSYLNQTYTEKELNRLGVTGHFEKNHVTELMPPHSFWIITNEPQGKTVKNPPPDVFAVVVKDPHGRVSNVIGFKSLELLKAFIAKKEAQGYIDGKEAFRSSSTYPLEYVIARFGNRFEEISLPALGHNLNKGFYRISTKTIPGTTNQVHAIAINNAGKLEICYVKNNHREKFVKDLEQHSFRIEGFEESDGEGEPISNRYNQSEILSLAEENDLTRFNNLKLKPGEYYQYDIPFKNEEEGEESTQFIYALAVEDNDGRHPYYFRSQAGRDTFIQNECNEYIDREELEAIIFGTKDKSGIVSTPQMAKCNQPGEFWTWDILIGNRTIYAIVYCDEKNADNIANNYLFDYWRTPEERNAEITTGFYRNSERFFNVTEHEAQIEQEGAKIDRQRKGDAPSDLKKVNPTSPTTTTTTTTTTTPTSVEPKKPSVAEPKSDISRGSVEPIVVEVKGPTGSTPPSSEAEKPKSPSLVPEKEKKQKVLVNIDALPPGTKAEDYENQVRLFSADYLIPFLVVNDGDYWLTSFETIDCIFYKEAGTLKIKLMPKDQGAAFITTNQTVCIKDIRKAVIESDVYPDNLAQFLIKKIDTSTEWFKKHSDDRLYHNEYLLFNKLETQCPGYPEIAVVAERDAKGEVVLTYCPSKQAALAYLRTKSGLKNGYTRYKSEKEIFALQHASFFNGKTPESAYRCFKSHDGEWIHLVKYNTKKNKVSNIGTFPTTTAQENLNNQIPEKAQNLDASTMANVAISKEETEYLKKISQKVVDSRNETNMVEKSYIPISLCGGDYVCLITRHPNIQSTEAPPQVHITSEFVRSHSEAYKNLLEKFDANKYTELSTKS